MKVQLLKEIDNEPAIFPIGSVIQVTDSDGQALIDAGTAKRVPDETPARIDPTGYMGCVPPQQLQASAASKTPIVPEKEK